jgi:hypothetical protein
VAPLVLCAYLDALRLEAVRGWLASRRRRKAEAREDLPEGRSLPATDPPRPAALRPRRPPAPSARALRPRPPPAPSACFP